MNGSRYHTLNLGLIILLIVTSLIGCVIRENEMDTTAFSTENASPLASTMVPTVPRGDSSSSASERISLRYGFPTAIDSEQRYLFYLHGKIIEDQGLPAISPEYGDYQYEEILDTLASYGFYVISEMRSKDTIPEQYAQRVGGQVLELIDSGVPADLVTVVGASKGAAIAILIADHLRVAEVNYVLLGSCHASVTDEFVQQGVTLTGNVLAISDLSDDYADSCEDLFLNSKGEWFQEYDEIILDLGLGHGLLYRPLKEWVEPTVAWANPAW